MYVNLATLAAFAFVYSVVAGRLERTAITGPIVFIGFGLLVGPLGLGLLQIDIEAEQLRLLAELTLVLVLFIDAASADLTTLRKHEEIPRRLLLLGLPMTIALGAVAGLVVFPEFSWFELCLLATMLAATDAALGKNVIANTAVPARLREGLNVESGLNDGLCVPLVLVFLALAAGDGAVEGTTAGALTTVVREIVVGALVGVTLATLGIRLVRLGGQRHWFTDVWAQIPVVGLALACFATANALQGSGFIAAFVGGLVYGRFTRKHTHELVIAASGLGELLAMLTWVIFGAALVSAYLPGASLPVLVYSVLSLTVIRIVPVLLSLAGLREPLESRLFLAWFGPRGLASIVFMIMILGANLPSEAIFTQVVVCTITLSVLAHGLTAQPWASGIGRRVSDD